ncbi:Uncharacterised protein [Pseudomonas aeruginosa]|nr:Uncharacterised protein [Pseudomonas aeruginosa]
MVDHQQQPLAAVSERRQQRAQQWPAAQVETALGLLRQGFQRLAVGDRLLPQQRLAGLDRAVFGAPGPVFEAEAQAQRIVVRQQGLQRRFQKRTVERLPRLQQDRLVPVLAPRDIQFEEHLLDRQQRRAPADRPLFGAGQAATLDGHAGQAPDRLVQEQVPGRQPDPGLARAADHLDGNDRVAAKFEEVVVQADAAKLQHIRPDRRQALLQLAARRGIVLLQAAGVRGGQGAPVQLAVGRQRQTLEEQQVGGHHVLRQARLQGLAQRVAQRGGVAWRRLRHDIADQLRSARPLVRQHDRLGHARLCEQAGLDFAQFDAEAANLDLVVDPTDVLDHPVATIAGQVAGPVQTSPSRGERIGHEARATQLGAIQIAPRQSRAPHIQLADAAPGHRVQPGVEQIPGQVRDRFADRTGRPAVEIRQRQRTIGHVDRGLGDPIHVDQARRSIAETLEPWAQGLHFQRLATEHHMPQGQRRNLLAGAGDLHQLLEGRRRLVQHRHPFPAQQAQEVLWRTTGLVRDDDQPAAMQQRAEDLPDGEIERVGVEQAPGVVRGETEPVPSGIEQA